MIYPELIDLLERAAPEDLKNLAKILKHDGPSRPNEIADRFHSLRRGIAGRFLTLEGDYKQLVTDVADHLEIDWEGLLRSRPWKEVSADEIEDAIVLVTFQKLFEKLSPEERRALAEELAKASNDPNLVGQILTGGAMVLARLSGFQIYILATTVVGALTSALGITLPFAIFTVATRAISVVLGPIGWIFLGASVIFQLSRANWARLVPGVVYVSYIRKKLNQEK
jgi:uncharacterized protein YaaW (UPF0174 family)